MIELSIYIIRMHNSKWEITTTICLGIPTSKQHHPLGSISCFQETNAMSFEQKTPAPTETGHPNEGHNGTLR